MADTSSPLSWLGSALNTTGYHTLTDLRLRKILCLSFWADVGEVVKEYETVTQQDRGQDTPVFKKAAGVRSKDTGQGVGGPEFKPNLTLVY